MRLIRDIMKNIGVIGLALGVFIVGSIGGNIIQPIFANYYLALIVPCIVRSVLTIALAGFVFSKFLKINPDELGIKLKMIDVKWIIIAVALPSLVLAFYAYLLNGDAHIAGDRPFLEYLVYAVFGVGIPAGINEELAFRGMIFRYMKKTLGVKIAVVVPAVLFACLHISNMQTFDLTDLILLILAGSSVSIMFTLMALDSDSIYPGALAHTLWNTLIIGGIFGVGEIVNGASNDSFIVISIESANKLLTGGNFGIEAAVPAIAGYIIVSVIGFIFYKRKES